MSEKLGISTGKGFQGELPFVTAEDLPIGSLLVFKTNGFSVKTTILGTIEQLYLPTPIPQSSTSIGLPALNVYTDISLLEDDGYEAYTEIGGVWRLCGAICDTITTVGGGSQSKKYYWLIQKIAN